MKKIIRLLLILMSCIALLSITSPKETLAFKFEPPAGLGIIPKEAGNSPEAIVETIIVNVLNLFFVVGGLGVIVYFVWGAVDWILSGGDKEKIANARKKMTHAIIGLVLLSLSFVLINLIGQIVGFNPLGNLQLRSLEWSGKPAAN